ncbi:MAG: hypothetical protein COA78_32110 [Blastopirellula sp.]|nr:MAG: hypothetical protein COA78_32110 [Blastopirellula sp.]
MTSPFSNPPHDVQPFRFDDYYPVNEGSEANHQEEKWQVFTGLVMAFIGLATIAIGSFFVFKNPMSNEENALGLMLWVIGSWLLGGGISLTAMRPLFACIIGFLTPGVAYWMFVFFYLGFAILSGMGSW